MNTIDSRTLAEQVFRALESAILEGEILPGTELSEVELAGQYGVSRGPVREALRQLGAVGLVSLTPRRPAIVRIMSKKEVLDAYQVREALERLGVLIAVPLLTDEYLAQLDKAMCQMQEAVDADDMDKFFEANSAFHGVFIEASGNIKLQETHRNLSRPMARYRRSSLKLRGDLESSLREHERIMQVVRAGDGKLAAELVAGHIHIPQDRLLGMSDEAWENMTDMTQLVADGDQ